MVNKISSKSKLDLNKITKEIKCFPVFVSNKIQIPKTKEIFLTSKKKLI